MNSSGRTHSGDDPASTRTLPVAAPVGQGTLERADTTEPIVVQTRRERRKTKADARTTQKKRKRRIIRRVIVIALIAFLIPTGWSYYRALSAPGHGPVDGTQRRVAQGPRAQRRRQLGRTLVVHAPHAAGRGEADARLAAHSEARRLRGPRQEEKHRADHRDDGRSSATTTPAAAGADAAAGRVTAPKRRRLDADRARSRGRSRRVHRIPAPRPDPHEPRRSRDVDGHHAPEDSLRGRAPAARRPKSVGSTSAAATATLAHRRVQLRLQDQRLAWWLLQRRPDLPHARRRCRVTRHRQAGKSDRRPVGPRHDDVAEHPDRPPKPRTDDRRRPTGPRPQFRLERESGVPHSGPKCWFGARESAST